MIGSQIGNGRCCLGIWKGYLDFLEGHSGCLGVLSECGAGNGGCRGAQGVWGRPLSGKGLADSDGLGRLKDGLGQLKDGLANSKMV